jgi:hypothetical protein
MDGKVLTAVAISFALMQIQVNALMLLIDRQSLYGEGSSCHITEVRLV